MLKMKAFQALKKADFSHLRLFFTFVCLKIFLMKLKEYRLLLLFFALNTSFTVVLAQDTDFGESLPASRPPADELQLPSAYLLRELPAVVDNSQTPYFRPIFNQDGASCGQASSLGYLFTYEMCRKRNVQASIPANQFPSHFAYNFMSYDGYYGVNYLHSMEIARAVGSPDLETYGGMSVDDGVVWKSGYDLYYNAMCNRASKIRMIRTGDEAGLNNLKHWLAHHHEGDVVGGLANFASGTPYNLVNIPPLTPEAGKKIITAFPGTVATHAMTIVGYNDSIRYDINNDGKYTNHLDINGDGVVDMRDWEIGALKIANSYGDNWGNQGYYYALYRTLALNEYNGGIWGNMVHVMDVKADYHPQMAIKVGLKHSLREQIKVRAGIASCPIAPSPEHILDFPIFNYQGGKHFMQGGTSNEAHKTIEFGLDITPLLSYVEPGQPAVFFLEVFENDPYSLANGEIVSFALMDYSSGNLQEIPCQTTPMPLINDALTSLKIVYAPMFDAVEITTAEIPLFDSLFQLQAAGGTQPYEWELLTHYHQQMTELPMPQSTQQQLMPAPPYNKFAAKALGFSFPFYGQNYDTVYVNMAGFILFEKDIFPWRYLRDSYHLFREMKNISAFLFAPILFYEGTKSQKGVWYEGDESHATFRWNLDLIYYDHNFGEAEFALTLFPDGSIDFFYNGIEVNENIRWFAGVSAGEGMQHTLLKGANSRNFFQHRSFRLVPELVPNGLSLSEEGMLSADGALPQNSSVLAVKVTDQRGVSGFKELQVSTDLRWSCTFQTADAEPPSSGAEVLADLKLSNVSQQVARDMTLVLRSSDPYFMPIDTLVSNLSLMPGESTLLPEAFSFKVKPDCPDGHVIFTEIEITSSIGVRNGRLPVRIRGGAIGLSDYFINDNDNHLLDPGEMAQGCFVVTNNGSMMSFGVKAKLTSSDVFLNIEAPTQQHLGNLAAGASDTLCWNIGVSPDCPMEHEAVVVFSLSDSLGVQFEKELTFRIGQYAALIVLKSTDAGSAQSISRVFDDFSLEYRIVEAIDEDIDKYRAVFLCQGTYGTNISLTAGELETLKSYLDQGGNVYREAFYGWMGTGIIPSYFGLQQKDVSNPQTFNYIEGVLGTDFEEVNADFYGEVNYMIFKLMPTLSTASPILFSNLTNDAWVGVGNKTALYSTIAMLYEFGNFGSPDENEKREILMKAILHFFSMDHLIMGNNEQVQDEAAARFVKAYPNPFGEKLSLNFVKELSGKVELSLYSGEGRQLLGDVIHLRQGGTIVWDAGGRLGRLKAGLYFLRLTHQNKPVLLPLLKR